jgi:hypothetical protein
MYRLVPYVHYPGHDSKVTNKSLLPNGPAAELTKLFQWMTITKNLIFRGIITVGISTVLVEHNVHCNIREDNNEQILSRMLEKLLVNGFL